MEWKLVEEQEAVNRNKSSVFVVERSEHLGSAKDLYQNRSFSVFS